MKNKKLDYLRPCDIDFESDEWSELNLEIQNIKKGDIFYECERGCNYQLTALTDSRQSSDGWMCLVKDKNGKIHEVYIAENINYRGPNFYREPIYTVKDQEKGIVYLID